MWYRGTRSAPLPNRVQHHHRRLTGTEGHRRAITQMTSGERRRWSGRRVGWSPTPETAGPSALFTSFRTTRSPGGRNSVFHRRRRLGWIRRGLSPEGLACSLAQRERLRPRYTGDGLGVPTGTRLSRASVGGARLLVGPEGPTGRSDRVPDAVSPAPVMARKSQRRPADRLDLHNASIDERVADTHRCGFVDLRIGRVCLLAVGHPGSCHFVGHDEIDAVLRTSGGVTPKWGQPGR